MVYAYATTMRRAQGATLELVGLHFDRRRADRGYAYVGTSRAKLRRDVFLLGRIRRSDWLPVGGDARGGEQAEPGPMSESDSEEPSSSMADSMDDDSEDMDSPDEGFAAWNQLRPRDWEEPDVESESEGSDWGMGFGAHDGSEGFSGLCDDAAGLLGAL